jgi:hypothetical protein
LSDNLNTPATAAGGNGLLVYYSIIHAVYICRQYIVVEIEENIAE